MHQLGFAGGEAAAGNQLRARSTAFREADRDFIARRSGRCRRCYLLWLADSLTQLGNSDIRRIDTRFEVREPLQHHRVVGEDELGLREGSAPPANEGHGGEDERKH